MQKKSISKRFWSAYTLIREQMIKKMKNFQKIKRVKIVLEDEENKEIE